MTRVKQPWIESERGYGQKFFGYSYHPSSDALEKYIDLYWEWMPDEVQEWYIAPQGTPELEDVEIDDKFVTHPLGYGPADREVYKND